MVYTDDLIAKLDEKFAMSYTAIFAWNTAMAYVVLPTITGRFGPRKGLEGPFNFSGRVLYYDNRQGQYYDPLTDFYVEQEEMDDINQRFFQRFAGPFG